MSMTSPEVARAVHDDRRRRLLADAEARRLRRVVSASRRPDESTRPLRGRFTHRMVGLVRGGREHDPKVARLTASWLDLDDETARELARAADEFVAPSGTRLLPGRFSYLGLDDIHRGLVVTTGTPPVTTRSPGTVLVLTTDDFEAIVPAMRLRAVVPPEPEPVDVPTERDAPARLLPVARRDRVVRRRNVAARPSELDGARAVAGSKRG